MLPKTHPDAVRESVHLPFERLANPVRHERVAAQHVAARVLAAEAAVNGICVREGRLRERDWRAIGRAVDITGDLELHVADNVATLDGLRAASLELIEQHGQLQRIVLDRLDPLLIGTRRKALAATARLAHDLSVPLLATTAARSTQPDRSDRATADVAGNDVVIEAADAMMMLDPSISSDRAHSTMDVRVVKNRFGPTGTIRLAMQTSVPLIRNAARPGDEAAHRSRTPTRLRSITPSADTEPPSLASLGQSNSIGVDPIERDRRRFASPR